MDLKCHRCPNKALPSWRGYCKKHYQYVLRQEGRTSGTVPVEAVQPHILALHDAGMPWVRIQELAGIHETSLRGIRRGVVRRVHIETAKALFAIQLPTECSEDAAPLARIPALGTQRRLMSLFAMGYSYAHIGRAVGMSRAGISGIVNANGALVSVDTARKIADLFRDWEMFPAPDTKEARRIRTIAKRRGYVPPFAWDESSIDNPAAQPQMPTTDRDGWFEDYLELQSLGLDDDQIAQRMGIRRDSLVTKVRRHHATLNRNQEHEQVRQGDEQVVREDWQAVAGF